MSLECPRKFEGLFSGPASKNYRPCYFEFSQACFIVYKDLKVSFVITYFIHLETNLILLYFYLISGRAGPI